jgi:putative acetyltransferase
VELVVGEERPYAEDVQALLERHLEFARLASPPEHVHALDIDGLLDPSVSFFTARRNGVLLGVGALKQLDETHGEIKSMHTSEAARGQGVGRAIVDHILSVAAERRYRKVSLETGATEEFVPARTLYLRSGFRPCPPFGRYTVNPYSACMTIDLGYRADVR